MRRRSNAPGLDAAKGRGVCEWEFAVATANDSLLVLIDAHFGRLTIASVQIAGFDPRRKRLECQGDQLARHQVTKTIHSDVAKVHPTSGH